MEWMGDPWGSNGDLREYTSIALADLARADRRVPIETAPATLRRSMPIDRQGNECVDKLRQ